MPAFALSTPLSTFRGTSLSRAVVSPPRSAVHARRVVRARLDALIFDCDGVLAETERDAHRLAFNLAFDEENLNTVWDEALYGKLLETGGGKERMTAYWNEQSWPPAFSTDEDRVALVKRLHARKTVLFMELVAAGKVPLRPGVARLVGEAVLANVPVAVCSTSNEKAVAKIVDMLGDVSKDISIFAGDVVKKKKPSPDIYNLAAEKLQIDASNVCVIEDSFIGLSAARAAGMPCVVTKSTYSENEDFAAAQKVLNSLDDPMMTLDDLTQMVESMKVNA